MDDLLNNCQPFLTFVSLESAAIASLVFSMYVGRRVKMSKDSWAKVAIASEICFQIFDLIYLIWNILNPLLLTLFY